MFCDGAVEYLGRFFVRCIVVFYRDEYAFLTVLREEVEDFLHDEIEFEIER